MTLVVRRRRPLWVLGGAVAVTAAVAAVPAWLAVLDERESLATATAGARAEHDDLVRERETLRAERDELARKLAILERTRQVESEAYARVDKQLADLEDELLSLKEEVAFYKGIVSDDSRGSGVRIQRFTVEADGTQQDFRFRLVLTRGIRSDNVASGAVTLAVDGDRDGERLTLTLQELTPFPIGPLEYSFKHFQRLEGRLHLPPRFVPRKVIVQLDAAQSGSKPLRETFQWPSMKS